MGILKNTQKMTSIQSSAEEFDSWEFKGTLIKATPPFWNKGLIKGLLTTIQWFFQVPVKGGRDYITP